jgi:hypothetical protein
MNNQSSLGEDFVRAVVNFPKFLLQYTVGVLIFILSDYNLFTMALLGIVAGFVANAWLVGVLVFLGVYVASRALSAAIGQVAEAVGHHARIQLQIQERRENPPYVISRSDVE